MCLGVCRGVRGARGSVPGLLLQPLQPLHHSQLPDTLWGVVSLRPVMIVCARGRAGGAGARAGGRRECVECVYCGCGYGCGCRCGCGWECYLHIYIHTYIHIYIYMYMYIIYIYVYVYIFIYIYRRTTWEYVHAVHAVSMPSMHMHEQYHSVYMPSLHLHAPCGAHTAHMRGACQHTSAHACTHSRMLTIC